MSFQLSEKFQVWKSNENSVKVFLSSFGGYWHFFWSTERKSGIIKKLVFALLGCEVDKIFLENFDLIHCLALISMSLQRGSQRKILWLYLFL